MTRKPAAKTQTPIPAASTPVVAKPNEAVAPLAPLLSAGRASGAARLLRSKGSAPAANTLPSSVSDVVQHTDSTGPDQAPSRANKNADGPRHFRRSDTWRGDV